MATRAARMYACGVHERGVLICLPTDRHTAEQADDERSIVLSLPLFLLRFYKAFAPPLFVFIEGQALCFVLCVHL